MKQNFKLHKLLQTLGDINRLRIIHFIGKKQCSVSEVVDAVNLSQPLVSHHLRSLKENGILKTTRKGPFIYYELANRGLLDVLGILSELAKESGFAGESDYMFTCPKWWNKKSK